jgi:hypothetical protein
MVHEFQPTEDHFDVLGAVLSGDGKFQANRECVELLYWGYLEPVQYGDGAGVGITDLGERAYAAYEDGEA